ncbi:type IV pilus biogenesis/stability protein PilW [Nocardia ignorata]|uniref:tetratricopeptide repeat protein n=1 Tax=Nocardia ignorata TaxID=145285 RepID=UPI00362F9138
MNRPGAQRPGDVPLEHRYTGADPIDWCGADVYPMYTEALPTGTTALRLRALSVMPPADVSGLGLGLTVTDGHVNLGGRTLGGVDIWSDALAAGIDITVTAEAPEALFTLTPVWVAGAGPQQSWTGNYGMVVDLLPNGASTLWCSTGPGTPDFNELVVELTRADADPAPTDQLPRVGAQPLVRAEPPLYAKPTACVQPVVAAEPTAQPYAEQNVGRALHDLGSAMFARGEHDSARVLWAQAAEAGNSAAAYDLGLLALHVGDIGAARTWWQAAAHEDPRAAACLAELPQRT